MTKIKIKCPDCKKEITIKIKTIDKLNKKIQQLVKEIKDYKAKKAARKVLNKKDKYADVFEQMLGGKR